MSDKTKPTPTPGPWRYSESEYGCHEFIITGSDEHGGMVFPILGRTHNWPRNAQANAALIAAAGTAAHEVAQQGYDPVEVIRALPMWLRDTEDACGSEDLRKYIARAAGNGGDDAPS